jgi:hypothetical protein
MIAGPPQVGSFSSKQITCGSPPKGAVADGSQFGRSSGEQMFPLICPPS